MTYYLVKSRIFYLLLIKMLLYESYFTTYGIFIGKLCFFILVLFLMLVY